jgi:hypothetical protein
MYQITSRIQEIQVSHSDHRKAILAKDSAVS